jgi:hypothetical protein
VLYDQQGVARAYCAEAEDDETVMYLRRKIGRNASGTSVCCPSRTAFLTAARRWKLHLRPSHLPLMANLNLPPLPSRVTVDIVLADFLGYVKQNLQMYITTSHGGGDKIWAALYPAIEVVLTVPNGWEGVQQQRMRTAAFKAGLVDQHGAQRVRIVTEAEVRTSCMKLSFHMLTANVLFRLQFSMRLTVGV